jgi:hypothetical protein
MGVAMSVNVEVVVDHILNHDNRHTIRLGRFNIFGSWGRGSRCWLRLLIYKKANLYGSPAFLCGA